MKFICQGESFKAISAMLNCYIPYWKRDHPNTSNKVIEMNDTDAKVLELFLIYIHLGSVFPYYQYIHIDNFESRYSCKTITIITKIECS